MWFGEQVAIGLYPALQTRRPSISRHSSMCDDTETEEMALSASMEKRRQQAMMKIKERTVKPKDVIARLTT